MRRAMLLYNPAAGRFPVRPFIHSADKVLSKAGWSLEIIETRSSDHIVQMAKQAASEKFDAVFAVGGDGTLGKVASGLVDSETALGVLPAGTSNVWARELNLVPFSWMRCWTLQENAGLLAKAVNCPIDIGICNDHPFLMWVGMGLDAMTVQKIEPRMRLEKFFTFPEYAASTIWNASIWHGLNLRLWVDDTEVEGHYLLAVVNNIRHYMGGLAELSPEAYLDDGIFDIWLFSGANLVDAFRHAFDLWAGRHVDSKEARRIPFRNLHLEADALFSVQMDGEPAFNTRQAVISVRQRAIRVLLPPHSFGLLKNPPSFD